MVQRKVNRVEEREAQFIFNLFSNLIRFLLSHSLVKSDLII